MLRLLEQRVAQAGQSAMQVLRTADIKAALEEAADIKRAYDDLASKFEALVTANAQPHDVPDGMDAEEALALASEVADPGFLPKYKALKADAAEAQALRAVVEELRHDIAALHQHGSDAH